MNKISLSAVLLLGFPAVANAQAGPGATADATASAVVVKPISIGCTGMNFAQLAPLKDSGASVTIPPDGGNIADPDNIVVPGTRTTATPTSCSVFGELNLGYTITLPSAATISNGSETMTLDGFRLSSMAGDQPNQGRTSRTLATSFGGDGFDGFGVGATLNVGADQAPGHYTGTFPVSVKYN